VALDPARRAQLLQGKLRALATEHLGEAEYEPIPYFAGSAVFDVAHRRVVVIVEAAVVDRDPLDIATDRPRPNRGWLGGALVLAARRDAAEVHCFADNDLLIGEDAALAAPAAIPVTCWRVVGRTAAPIAPEPPAPQVQFADLRADEQAFRSLIEANGALAIVEGGVLRAEVLGLEVGRVLRDAETDEPYFAVGVGKHDRLAQSMMHPGADPAVALRGAVASVLDHRIVGAPSHPANTASRSRWLREMLVVDPARFGFHGPVTRLSSFRNEDLKQSGVAAARVDNPTNQKANPVLVGCRVGVDLDAPLELLQHFVPTDTDVVLVVPAQDVLPALVTLCALLRPFPNDPLRAIRVSAVEAPFVGSE
jgi:hypothetical protein